MSAILKSLLITCAVLSMAAVSTADEPARSVLDGGRPLAVPSEKAKANSGCAAVGSIGTISNSNCGCKSGCAKNICQAGSGLFECTKDACVSSCNSDCGNSCREKHGCWLHQSHKTCAHSGCGNGGCGSSGYSRGECGNGAYGADNGVGCNTCGSDRHHHGNGHRHGKHTGCGNDCHGDGYHQGRFCTRCNMIPHIAYINPLSSYYYFRPYQAFHVREHQNEVVTYGGDPRNPYANHIFHNLYAELEATWAEEEAAKLGSPFDDEVPAEKKSEAETPEPTPIDPPTAHYKPSHTPANRLQAVQQAKPIDRSAVQQERTVSVPNQQRRVFRVKK